MRYIIEILCTFLSGNCIEMFYKGFSVIAVSDKKKKLCTDESVTSLTGLVLQQVS